MKTITLLRHCKSDWGSDALSDIDRPLNKRGTGDIPLIAKRFNELGFKPDVCFYSVARRARETAIGVTELMDANVTTIERSDLYAFDYLTFLSFIQSIPKEYKHVLLVAHNPGLTDLINLLGNVRLDNLPTGGYCQFELNVSSWDMVEENTCTLKFLEYPKMFKD